MELKNIYELWDRFDQSQASKLEIEMSGVHLVLEKDNGVVVAPKQEQLCENTIRSLYKEETPYVEENIGTAIKAPIVGTFYRAPAEDAEPFVQEGQKVKKGDVVGIIEAMKLMNEITATEDGVVLSVEAKDGEMVEYGEVLVNLG